LRFVPIANLGYKLSIRLAKMFWFNALSMPITDQKLHQNQHLLRLNDERPQNIQKQKQKK